MPAIPYPEGDVREELGSSDGKAEMTERPRMVVRGIVLDSPDARALAAFYQRLLGWAIKSDEPGWVTMAAPDGPTSLSFQTDTGYARPTWPAGEKDQQMMLHLDIEVDDLAVAGAYATAAGAVLAEFQPQQDVRVFLDPAGHPFCLFLAE
jgi:catechol 2,3-dioxygenase-like lactoylglutathione lyase family enzyme